MAKKKAKKRVVRNVNWFVDAHYSKKQEIAKAEEKVKKLNKFCLKKTIRQRHSNNNLCNQCSLLNAQKIGMPRMLGTEMKTQIIPNMTRTHLSGLSLTTISWLMKATSRIQKSILKN